MKKVSCEMFFTVLWRGLCQALAWFFGLFGYKREGKFAHCVWGLFAVSCTLIVTIIACAFVYALGNKIYSHYNCTFCDGEDCEYNTYVSPVIRFHDHDNGNGELINTQTGEKTLTGIAWISTPIGEKDSLAVFSDGKKRGYFNIYTGKVVIPTKYSRAWVFSDGIASVEDNGIVKFIDSKGNQIFNRTFTLDNGSYGYVFHGGYCIIDSNNDKKFGLMDTNGKTVLPEIYDEIHVSSDDCLWALTKENKSGVYNKDLKPILPMMECVEICLLEYDIDVTMFDNTMRKYDLQGNLIDDFYINDFNYLEYETEETYQTKETYTDEDNQEHEYLTEPQHKTARARLCMYEAGRGMEGLMTADGHVVTMPKYENIIAIGPDTYLCTVSNYDKEVVNGKGQKVK